MKEQSQEEFERNEFIQISLMALAMVMLVATICFFALGAI